MKRIFVFLAILLLSVNVYSQGKSETAGIKATTYADGVLFENKGKGQGMNLVVSGPGNSINSKRYSNDKPVFLGTSNDSGEPLPDGFYKYEATEIPAFTFSRAESAKLRDRNELNGKSDPKSSPVSGHFRIADGVIVDSLLEEYDSGPGKGNH